MVTAGRSAPGRSEQASLERACGQHRLDRSGDVDAGGPPERLAVEQRALRDVGSDVRDVYPHPGPPRRGLLGGDRVVVVARTRGVDGEGRELAQVPALAGLAADPLRGLPGLALQRGIETAPEAPVEHQPLDHVRGDVWATEDADDLWALSAAPALNEHEVPAPGPRARPADAPPGPDHGARSRVAGRPPLRGAPRCEQRDRGEEASAALEHGHGPPGRDPADRPR